MSHKFKLLFLIAAIVLVPILLGITPMNLFQKLSIPCPHSQDKQIQRSTSCLFNSIVSQDDSNTISLNSTLQVIEPTPSFHIEACNSIQSDNFSLSVPLRR
jgi:hypothetical protein